MRKENEEREGVINLFSPFFISFLCFLLDLSSLLLLLFLFSFSVSCFSLFSSSFVSFSSFYSSSFVFFFSFTFSFFFSFFSFPLLPSPPFVLDLLHFIVLNFPSLSEFLFLLSFILNFSTLPLPSRYSPPLPPISIILVSRWPFPLFPFLPSSFHTSFFYQFYW